MLAATVAQLGKTVATGSIRGRAPQILLCPETSFLTCNKNKNLAFLQMYFSPPNLKTWLRACNLARAVLNKVVKSDYR